MKRGVLQDSQSVGYDGGAGTESGMIRPRGGHPERFDDEYGLLALWFGGLSDLSL